MATAETAGVRRAQSRAVARADLVEDLRWQERSFGRRPASDQHAGDAVRPGQRGGARLDERLQLRDDAVVIPELEAMQGGERRTCGVRHPGRLHHRRRDERRRLRGCAADAEQRDEGRKDASACHRH